MLKVLSPKFRVVIFTVLLIAMVSELQGLSFRWFQTELSLKNEYMKMSSYTSNFLNFGWNYEMRSDFFIKNDYLTPLLVIDIYAFSKLESVSPNYDYENYIFFKKLGILIPLVTSSSSNIILLGLSQYYIGGYSFYDEVGFSYFPGQSLYSYLGLKGYLKGLVGMSSGFLSRGYIYIGVNLDQKLISGFHLETFLSKEFKFGGSMIVIGDNVLNTVITYSLFSLLNSRFAFFSLEYFYKAFGYSSEYEEFIRGALVFRPWGIVEIGMNLHSIEGKTSKFIPAMILGLNVKGIKLKIYGSLYFGETDFSDFNHLLEFKGFGIEMIQRFKI